MKFKVKIIPFQMERFSAVFNKEDAAEMGLIAGDRVKITYERKYRIADIHIVGEMIERGEIGISMSDVGIEEGSMVAVSPVSKPASVEHIKKKMNGERLDPDEINLIIEDTLNGMLTDVELAAFVLSNYFHGMSPDEIEWMTRSVINTGETLSFERGIVVDKHSVGGVPGNKVAQILVPTIAAAGLLIPKTASRAITSASGTADTFGVLADVNIKVDELKEITENVGGAIVWSGATGISPASRKFINISRALRIDPEPHILSSLMSDKAAKNPKYVIIDIPIGEEAKVKDVEFGQKLANQFMELGRRMGILTATAITYGGQPVGRAVGPALEAKEALKAMEGRTGTPTSLMEKVFGLSGIIFEMAGKTGNGRDYAKELFNSGKVLEKYKEIIEAQSGDPNISSDSVPIGDKVYEVTSNSDGSVVSINNTKIVKIARGAGAPKDKGAGVYIHKKKGEYVRNGETILTIYAEKEWKLTRAIELAIEDPPIMVSGMILHKTPYHRMI